MLWACSTARKRLSRSLPVQDLRDRPFHGLTAVASLKLPMWELRFKKENPFHGLTAVASLKRSTAIVSGKKVLPSTA